MSNNFLSRIITSFFLLSLLFLIIFSHHYIFLLSILIISIIIFIESHNIFSKLIANINIVNKTSSQIFNLRFLILNLITFCYIFFIFCYFSYEIFKFEGPIFFLYLISICFFTDIGGYAFGKIIGGKKLSKISPNKTISGVIGSFIFSIIPLIIFFKLDYLNLELDLNHVFFNLTVSLVSQLGDLLVSFFKRKAKIKDTGKILPGHGGILDRVDGIIFAIPFSYFLLKFF